MKTLLKGAGLGAILATCASAALAQEQSTNRVNAITDWSVFVEQDPTQCWVVSSPTETVNTKDGRVVAVNRGDILMFVSYWPGAGKLGEVSFTGGYPFGEGSTVTLEIGSSKFDLFRYSGVELKSSSLSIYYTGQQCIGLYVVFSGVCCFSGSFQRDR